MKITKIFLYLSVPIIFIFLWGFVFEPDLLLLKKETISIDKWDKNLEDLKIIVIGDLHTGSPFNGLNKLDKIVMIANSQNPDIILLLGDYVVNGVIGKENINPFVIAKKLGKLKPKLATFAVLGNHDNLTNPKLIEESLWLNKIRVLKDDVVKIDYNGSHFWIAGLKDLMTDRPKPKEVYKMITDNYPVIFLTHDPDIFQEILPDVSLTIAAHTHGGQVRLPFINSPIVPSAFGNLYAKGVIQQNHKYMLVTTGVGTSIIPVRFGVIPEIIVLRIKQAVRN